MPKLHNFLVVAILFGGLVLLGSASADSVTPKPEFVEPLFQGLGSVHHPVSTKSALAQRYFDQGLAFTYGFNHDEAERSFQQAAKIDHNLAMAYWGIALVLGPNYNLPGDKERGARAVAALKQSQSYEASASPEERDLIAALGHRYGSNGEPSSERDAAYAKAMRAVAYRYPDDPDAQVLFAEALMDLHPWQLWSTDGKPEAGTVEIVSVLEWVLKKTPNHVGANHYYIHAVEASRDPARALPSADRLGHLAPGAGHLVHMPSHIYIRTGRYHDAAVVNQRAVAVDSDFLRKTGESGYYLLAYYAHNYHFLCYAEMMEGRGQAALKAARELERHLPLDDVRAMPMSEFLVPTPLFVETRFGMWNEILHEPSPPEDLPFATGSWHYARGIAFTELGRPDEALKESVALEKILQQTPAKPSPGYSKSREGWLSARFCPPQWQDRHSQGRSR
jgi:tetratricopeptide (TPR) repeat protein